MTSEAQQTPPALQARGVGHRIGDTTIVGPVDFRISAGELVALVGPNGAGKSTMLSILSGELGHDHDIEVMGTPMSSLSPRQLARLRAVLPQDSTVTFPFRVHEVVAMGRAPWRRTPQESEDQVHIDSAMADCSITDLAGRAITDLSGGERARVAIARVLAQQTPLVLLDEPTAALDIHHQEQIFEVLRHRATAGSAVIVVVHDLSLAAAFADRVVVLDDGLIAADGPHTDALTPEILGPVYHHNIAVLTHPGCPSPLIVPVRTGDTAHSDKSHSDTSHRGISHSGMAHSGMAAPKASGSSEASESQHRETTSK